MVKEMSKEPFDRKQYLAKLREDIDNQKIVFTPYDESETPDWVREYHRQLEKQEAIKSAVLDGLHTAGFVSLAGFLKVLSIVLKILGIIPAIGSPYGVFCMVRLFLHLADGAKFADLKDDWLMAQLFVILPIALLIFSFIAKRAAGYFFIKR